MRTQTRSNVAALVGKTESDGSRSILKELGFTASEQALFQLHEAVGEMEKALPPSRFFRCVMFGSARSQSGDGVYEEQLWLARNVSEKGIDIVTGGGPGLMEAASRGAMEGRRKSKRVWSWGVCIEQINRDEPPNVFLSRAYRHRNFFTRLHHFARLGGTGAFVVMPGGIGSLLELAMIWQLLQVGHLKDVPLIAVGDMWAEIIGTMKEHMVPNGFARADEMDRVILVPSGRDALPIILEAHQRFKAMKAAG